jgi:hypothetical protein
MSFISIKVKQKIYTVDTKCKGVIIVKVKVLYKDYSPVTGEPFLLEATYKSWNHEGNYTIFYDDISLDSASFIIPTNNVCWIKLIRD